MAGVVYLDVELFCVVCMHELAQIFQDVTATSVKSFSFFYTHLSAYALLCAENAACV